MPTIIRFANVQTRNAFPRVLQSVSIFLVIGMIQIVVAVLSADQWASFGEQSLWWWRQRFPCQETIFTRAAMTLSDSASNSEEINLERANDRSCSGSLPLPPVKDRNGDGRIQDGFAILRRGFVGVPRLCDLRLRSGPGLLLTKFGSKGELRDLSRIL
jgi:hypothetical protein